MPPQGVPRRAGVNSLGVGGTNAHIVVWKQAPRARPPARRGQYQLLVLSAKSLGRSMPAPWRWPGTWQSQPAVDPRRCRLHAADRPAGDEAPSRGRGQRRRGRGGGARREGCRSVCSPTPRPTIARSVAFMFAGGGAQYPNMGLDLYREEPVFRAAVDECLALCEARLNRDAARAAVPARGPGGRSGRAGSSDRPSRCPRCSRSSTRRPGCWMSWGVAPAAMIGHSMGEYTAAHLAGVFTSRRRADPRGAARPPVRVAARRRHAERADGRSRDPGPDGRPSLSIVGDQRPEALTVVGGPVAAIEALQARLAGAGDRRRARAHQRRGALVDARADPAGVRRVLPAHHA